MALIERSGKTTYGALPILMFDDATGAVVEPGEVGHGRLSDALPPESAPRGPPAAARGRPRLGVVAREVTLLPRHWDWLASQPGGASAALRRLVEAARTDEQTSRRDQRRASQQAAYRFMTAMGGDRPNYEEALRALFAGDRDRFADLLASWPADLRAHALALAVG
jgi:uncharacterized protein